MDFPMFLYLLCKIHLIAIYFYLGDVLKFTKLFSQCLTFDNYYFSSTMIDNVLQLFPFL